MSNPVILSVVSICPVCAAPIYGSQLVDSVALSPWSPGNPVPHLAVFSCDCRQHLVLRLQLENSRTMAEGRKLAVPGG